MRRVRESALWFTRSVALSFALLFPLTNVVTAYSVSSVAGAVFDASRTREIAYTLYFPENFTGDTHVLLFSHGGSGSPSGHTRYVHFGEHWAASGYVGLHINHLSSAVAGAHRIDRPADVSFVLDALQSGLIEMPPGFGGAIATDRFGHAGHSYGAYTSMAVAGGDFLLAPAFLDPRIVAIAPVSPQGAGQFGAYDIGDNGPTDHTWMNINIPAFNIVGEDEKDTNAIGTILEEDWRLTPFERYPAVGDKFQVVLPGQDHADLGAFPTAEIQTYLGENTTLFFDVYLKGETEAVCDIATSPPFAGQSLSGLPDLAAGIAAPCPPPIGVPEPSLLSALIAGWIALLRIHHSSKRHTRCAFLKPILSRSSAGRSANIRSNVD